MRPGDHRINEFATLNKFMEGCVQFAQILMRKATFRRCGRSLTRSRCGFDRSSWVAGRGNRVESSIVRINARHWRACERGIGPDGGIILAVTKIVADQR